MDFSVKLMKYDGNRLERWIAHKISETGIYRTKKQRDYLAKKNTSLSLQNSQLREEISGGWQQAENKYAQDLELLRGDLATETKKTSLLEEQLKALDMSLESSQNLTRDLRLDLSAKKTELESANERAYLAEQLSNVISSNTSEAYILLGSRRIVYCLGLAGELGETEIESLLSSAKKIDLHGKKYSAERVPLTYNGKNFQIVTLKKKLFG